MGMFSHRMRIVRVRVAETMQKKRIGALVFGRVGTGSQVLRDTLSGGARGVRAELCLF